MQHMDDLVFIFDQYDNPLFSASLLNVGALDDIRAVSEIRELKLLDYFTSIVLVKLCVLSGRRFTEKPPEPRVRALDLHYEQLPGVKAEGGRNG